MLSVKNGDLDQARFLYDRYKVPIYNFFLNRMPDAPKAADQMQNTFERVLKYRTNFDGNRNFRSWLFTIARNLWIDEMKTRKSTVSTDEVFNLVADDAYNRMDNHALLKQAMYVLNQEERDIIVMAKIEHRKYIEIADLYGYSEANVKVKVYRIMKKLRDILENKLNYEH